MKAFIFTLSTLISFVAIANSNISFSAYSFTHPLETEQVKDFINTHNPSLKEEVKQEIAGAIIGTSLKHNIRKEVLLSIIAVESSFKPSARSATGDFSIVQINYKTWAKEFKRMKKKTLSFTKLNSDITYSIELMGEILSHLKTRYASNDTVWFARYHSKTPKYKNLYANRLMGKNVLKLPLVASF